MRHRLYSYLEELKILYPLQFSFREKCSTTHAPVFPSLNLFASPLILINEFGCAIFIDFTKAFDAVYHCLSCKPIN